MVKDAGDDVVFAYSADGSTFASGDGSRSATLWDAKAGAKLQSFEWETESVPMNIYRPIRSSLAFSPDGSMLASAAATIRFVYLIRRRAPLCTH